MLNPFVILLDNILQLYLLIIIAWTILSTLVSFKIVNSYQPIVKKILYALDRLCEPALKPIQKLLPDLGGFDLSPIVLILLINFFQHVLFQYFYNL